MPDTIKGRWTCRKARSWAAARRLEEANGSGGFHYPNSRSVAEQLVAVRESGVDHCVIMYFAVMEAAALLERLHRFDEEVLPLLPWRVDSAQD